MKQTLQDQTLKRYVTQKRLQVNTNNSREVLEAEVSKHFATVVRRLSSWRAAGLFHASIPLQAGKAKSCYIYFNCMCCRLWYDFGVQLSGWSCAVAAAERNSLRAGGAR